MEAYQMENVVVWLMERVLEEELEDTWFIAV
jgi:hypothetical protein